LKGRRACRYGLLVLCRVGVAVILWSRGDQPDAVCGIVTQVKAIHDPFFAGRPRLVPYCANPVGRSVEKYLPEDENLAAIDERLFARTIAPIHFIRLKLSGCC